MKKYDARETAIKKPLWLYGLALFCLTVTTRLLLLNKGPFDYDTLDYLMRGHETLISGAMQYAHGAGFPLAVLLSALSQAAGGWLGIQPVIAFNGFTAIVSGLAVWAFYLFARAWFDNRVAAIYAALLLSFFPAFFSISTFGRIDHMVEVLFVSLAFYFLVVSRDKGIGSRSCLLAGVCLGMAAAARLSSLIVFPVWIIWYWFFIGKNTKSHFSNIIAAISGVILTLALFYAPVLIIGRGQQFMTSLQDRSLGNTWLGVFTSRTPWAVTWEYWMLSFLGSAAAIFGLILLIRESWKKGLLLLIWFLPGFFYFANIASVNPRYLIIVTLPVFLAMAYFFYRLDQYRKNLGLEILLIQLAIMIIPMSALLLYRHKNDTHKEYVLKVEALVADGSTILAQDESIFLQYYIRNKKIDVINIPNTCDSGLAEAFMKNIDLRLAQGKNVYFVEGGSSYDDCNLLHRSFDERYVFVTVGKILNEPWYRSCISPFFCNYNLYRFIPRKIFLKKPAPLRAGS